MDDKLAMVSGVGVGVGLMFLLDPEQGRRRRSVVGGRLRSYADRSGEAVGRTSRHLAHRTRGLAAAARARLRSESVPEDAVLEARVRARLGRCVSHPHAVHVLAHEGRVTLSGAVLGPELDDLLRGVSRVRGVSEVENQLDIHDEADAIAELRRGVWDDEPEPALSSTIARAVIGAAGSGLALYGLKRRDTLGTALGAVGLGLIVRGLVGLDLGRLLGLRDDGGMDAYRTIHVNAPMERVFDLWSDYQNFPRFLSRVREVTDLGQGRSHWVAEGSDGMAVEWDAILTTYEPNARIGWRSLPGAPVSNVGIVRFMPDAEGGTRVEVFVSYAPPLGSSVGLFGTGAIGQLDDALLQMKAFVEGRADAGQDLSSTEPSRTSRTESAQRVPGPGL
jgi:uncharacterized membrane protein